MAFATSFSVKGDVMVKDTTSVVINGHRVTIRPIQSTDTGMEGDFVRRLSSLTKHYRFFGAVNELSAAELGRLCSVDGCQNMAFVATVREGQREVEVGVCRYANSPTSNAREMAITIADDWQHSDLARVLMQHLIGAAKRFGVRELYSFELSDNPTMIELAKELGMRATRDPADATQVVYRLSL
jgi:GNAT superfamily N-acetyltransferase